MPIVDKSNVIELERYTDFCKCSKYAVATQDPGWTYVKEGWDGEYVYLEDDKGHIIAGLSIIFRTVISSYTLAYAPRGPICDPYDIDLVKKLVEEAKPALKQHNAFVLRLDPETVFDEKLDKIYSSAGFKVRNRGFDKTQLIQPIFNMMLDIKDKDWESLMPAFSEKTRYNIRLSERKGVTVRWSRDVEDVELFHKIYLITCERDGIGARPLEYFTRMLKAFPDKEMRIYIAEHEGDALSAAIAINYGRKMWYLYGSSSNEKRNLMPNYAMQAAMIKWGIEEQKEIYDFGGVFILNKGNGLFKFKEGFCREKGVTELCGEYDLVLNGFWYKMFCDVVPAIKRIRAKVKR